MVQVSEASGGQVFLLDPSEIASSATLLLARDGLEETLLDLAAVPPGAGSRQAVGGGRLSGRTGRDLDGISGGTADWRGHA
jgi:hypothetical protein